MTSLGPALTPPPSFYDHPPIQLPPPPDQTVAPSKTGLRALGGDISTSGPALYGAPTAMPRNLGSISGLREALQFGVPVKIRHS